MTPFRFALPLLALSAGPAVAGAAPCWWDQGRLVVAAEVMGVAGDYLLDTGEPHTILAETHAQKSGFEATALTGEVRVAGFTLPERPIAVQDFDARSHTLPTPIAGVIGLDVLKAYVLDVRYAAGGACRVRLWEPGKAPAFRATRTLALGWAGERPTIPAIAADGPRVKPGAFVPSTAADAPVRLSDAGAQVEGAARPDAIYLYGDLRPRLRALSLAGELFENAPAGLIKADELPGADGVIGAPVLARWTLRFDFPAGELRLAEPVKEKGPRRRPRGP